MRTEAHRSGKHFVALPALVRFGRRRWHQMQFLFVGDHIPIAGERFATDVAVMILYTGMGDHMPGKIARR